MQNSSYIILVLFCLLVGCATKNSPPTDIYTLSPNWNDNRTQVKRKKNSKLIIKLTPVRAAGALTGTEIIYTEVQYVRSSYAFSRWNDSPVKLLPTLFLVALDKSNLFKAVVPPTSMAKTDFLLESNLLDLSHHINDDGTSEGVVRLRFYLIENKTKTVIATREFVSRVPASTQNAQGAVGALNMGATKVSRKLVNWLAELVWFLKKTRCSKTIPANCYNQTKGINKRR